MLLSPKLLPGSFEQTAGVQWNNSIGSDIRQFTDLDFSLSVAFQEER